MNNYRNLPQKMQGWYDSEAPATIADTLIADLHMKLENKVPLINIVGDTVLGLLSPADLPDQILNYIPMPLPLARVLAEHLLMLLAQAKISLSPVNVTPMRTAPPPSVQNPGPAQVTPSTPPRPSLRSSQTGAPVSYREPITEYPPAPAARHYAQPVASTPQPPPQQPQVTAPVSYREPVPPQANPSASTREVPAWRHHTYPDTPLSKTLPPPAAAPQRPATPSPRIPAPIPQYQRPLTDVPQYRNANLYQKPGGTPEPPSNLPI